MAHSHGAATEHPEQVKALNLPPNMSCLLIKTRTVSIEPIPLPVLQPDGVLVKVMANGICGSDMHLYLAGGVGGRPMLEPTVMGHEAAGEVIAVGANVTTHHPGDRVAVEPGLPCRRCINCKTGRSNICMTMKYCGSPGTHGSLSKFFALPADMAPHIPDSVSWDEAGSIQPLAIGCMIGKRADVRPHKTMAIFGCGPIGLISAAVSHVYSTRKIIAFDINPKRVEFAKKYISPLTGKPIIDHVFHIDALPSQPKSAQEGEHHQTEGDYKFEIAEARMMEILRQVGLEEEGGVDTVIEASGAGDAMMHGIAIAKLGGIYLQVGLGHVQTHVFPTIAVTNKDLEVRGLTRYTADSFPSAIDLLTRGVVNLKPLITTTFPLSRAQDAFEAVASGNEMKVIIKNQEA
ncbi:GroES-like protein [Xylariaceae sp. FL0255]|nr:GroES-like protein [Xylariaceae sp. FL0255]